jgi:hypothetical protein
MTATQPLPCDPIVVVAKGSPGAPSAKAEGFYRESLRELRALGIPFLLAGTYAVAAYTGITRATKDLDIFCKAGDYPRILGHFRKLGYEITVEDERWLAKVHKDGDFFDIIFASSNGTMPVSDSWFEQAHEVEVLGVPVRIVAPTELVWSKAFIQVRQRYDGADVVHVILKQHDQIDWHRLLSYMEQYWEVLLMHVLNFRFVYPSERECIPRWLIEELVDRVHQQLDVPAAQLRVCRGRMFSRSDYEIAVTDWGFADVGADGLRRDDL